MHFHVNLLGVWCADCVDCMVAWGESLDWERSEVSVGAKLDSCVCMLKYSPNVPRYAIGNRIAHKLFAS